MRTRSWTGAVVSTFVSITLVACNGGGDSSSVDDSAPPVSQEVESALPIDWQDMPARVVVAQEGEPWDGVLTDDGVLVISAAGGEVSRGESTYECGDRWFVDPSGDGLGVQPICWTVEMIETNDPSAGL
jgi:hypothetical protein